MNNTDMEVNFRQTPRSYPFGNRVKRTLTPQRTLRSENHGINPVRVRLIITNHWNTILILTLLLLLFRWDSLKYQTTVYFNI